MGVVRLGARGYYLAHEAGWLVGVSGDRIRQWARRGYIRSSVSSEVPRAHSKPQLLTLLTRQNAHAEFNVAVGLWG